MKYYFSKQLDVPFDAAVAKVIEALGQDRHGHAADEFQRRGGRPSGESARDPARAV